MLNIVTFFLFYPRFLPFNISIIFCEKKIKTVEKTKLNKDLINTPDVLSTLAY